MTSANDRSVSDLLGDAFAQFAKLIGNEIDLAKAEVSEKANHVARAAAFIGAGAVLLTPALVILLFSVAAALIRSGMSDSVAYLVTGGVVAVVAIALVMIGVKRLSAKALTPSVTIEQVKRDKAAVEGMVR